MLNLQTLFASCVRLVMKALPPQGFIISLENRKLISLLVWSRKVYETEQGRNEEQGIFISKKKTMNTDIIKLLYVKKCVLVDDTKNESLGLKFCL